MLGDSQNLKLYQEVLLKINDIIEEDKLTIGDRLPSERELAERLNVGRSSVREALRALELLGLISTRRGEGTYIEDHNSHRLVEIISFYVLRNEKAKKDLLELRKIIEIDLVRLAAERITKEYIQELEEILKRSEEKVKSGEIPLNEDYLFHKTIALASDNKLLYKIWNMAIEYGKTILEGSLERNGRPEVSISEHKKIIRALKDKNVKEAEQQMRAHLAKSEFYA
ncbi:transcriptional regulator [Vulcanibacillus modesticaldus]|uniref:Transcriptional regulator n=1 Tax=Vulcanibacillus modesticaldus TaxID=337097 RepID=A0A1D2YWF7_9BACI|nr:FadR/GntR family transcriptional regulator [Vulcanibacillus modesticaldus]OEG00075.1 transcriptional regulator [Vulcanibacillus modesticaldus]